MCAIVKSRGVNAGGVGGCDPQILGRGGHEDRRGSVGGRGRVIKYYYILSCRLLEVCSKVVTFEEKYNNLPRSSCK